MPTASKGMVDRLKEISLEYGDYRVADEVELRLYVWFHMYLFDELSQIQGVERGYTFRSRGLLTLLVYKATVKGLPRVVFITGNSPVDCMKIFCKQFYAGTLKWVDDKYA